MHSLKWEKVGSSSTSCTTNVVRKEVNIEIKYGLTVGFEVNKPSAFVNDVQILDGDDGDYGHAFFYLTVDEYVLNFFSFGPNGLAEPGKLTDEYSGSRPGTPDYPISEPVKLFRLKLNKEQSDALNKETNKIRNEIISGEMRYYAIMNDTCAETARDILKSVISTPEGSGAVKIQGFTTFFNVVNPYVWHKNFKAAYTEISSESIAETDLSILRPRDVDKFYTYELEEVK